MKFSILKTASNDFQFAVTTSTGQAVVPNIPTLTQAMHLTLAELKSATANNSDSVTGELTAPISPEIELWGAGVTYLR